MTQRKIIWSILVILLISTLTFQRAFATLEASTTINQAEPPQTTEIPSHPPIQKKRPPSHLNIFEDLWQVVNTHYLYADFNGVDWNAVKKTYQEKILGGLSDDEFYWEMAGMIHLLGDDHSVYLSPTAAELEDAQYQGKNNYVGIGVLLSALPQKGRAVVLLAFEDSPAAQAGIQPRDSILSVDGNPVLDEHGYISNILLGSPGSTVLLSVQSPGQDPREIEITRRQITGSLPVPFSIITTPEGRSVGYMLLVSFNDNSIDNKIADILETFLQNDVEAIIIDNRMNEGGADNVLINTLSYFSEGTLGHFVNRIEETPLHINRPRYILDSAEIPLVVLIGPETVSFGEIFSGILKDINRAYLIGEQTDGNIEILWEYEFADGSKAWIAHDTFRPVNNPNQDWEQTGIIPHLTVPVEWDEFSVKDDPAIQAALDYFDYR